jgi:hypothetical protein
MFSIGLGGNIFRAQLEEGVSHDTIARDKLSQKIQIVFEDSYKSPAEAVTALKNLQASITQELRAHDKAEQAERVEQIITSLAENVMPGARVAPKRAHEGEIEEPKAKRGRAAKKKPPAGQPSKVLIDTLIEHLPADMRKSLVAAAKKNMKVEQYLALVGEKIASLPVPITAQILRYLGFNDREGVLAILPQAASKNVITEMVTQFLNEVSKDDDFCAKYESTFGEPCPTWDELKGLEGEKRELKKQELLERASLIPHKLRELSAKIVLSKRHDFMSFMQGGQWAKSYWDKQFEDLETQEKKEQEIARLFDDVEIGKEIFEANENYERQKKMDPVILE